VKAREVPAQYAALQRFCCETLVRRDEAREMVGTEVRGNEWIIPAARMGKTKVDFLVTIPPLAMDELPQERLGKAGLVFTIDREPLGSLSKWKRKVDLRMLARLKDIAVERGDQDALAQWTEIERLIKLSADRKASKQAQAAARQTLKAAWWQPHDYRRNGRSYLSKEVDPDIAERTLAHVLPGIRGHYDLHDYAAEKRDALVKWSGELARIISGKPAGVTDIAQERQSRRKRGRS
jgi:hypothetical protein